MSLYIPIKEVIEDLCHATNDFRESKKLKYAKLAKFVYRDLNFAVVKQAKRQFFEINRNTHSIDMPCNFLKLSAVSVMDEFGIQHPLYRSDTIHDDIVDIAAKEDCACACKGKLCNLLKKYESIEEEVTEEMPDGSYQIFKTRLVKAVDDGGNFYQEKTFPIRRYEEGVWIDTELTTEYTELCRFELDEKSKCVKDCNSNYDKFYNCGCNFNGYEKCYGDSYVEGAKIIGCTSKFDWYMVDSGCYFAKCNMPFKNIYNISELGNRLLFPHDFPFKKVLIRFYINEKLNDMEIPIIAQQTAMTGLKYYEFKWDDKKRGLKNDYERDWANQKFALIGEINKYRLSELQMAITPHRRVP
mgnify:FL=1